MEYDDERDEGFGTTPFTQSNAPAAQPAASPMELVDTPNPADFDWNAYCSTYKGRALITRLSFIPHTFMNARQRLSPAQMELAKAAALRAIPIIKEQTWDRELYTQLVGYIKMIVGGDDTMDVDEGRTEADGALDYAWLEDVKAKEEAEASRLNVELNGYLSNLIKESIRLTYLAQAQLCIKVGNLSEALKAFQQVREYSSGPAHQLELGLGIIEAGLEFFNTSPLPGNITKAETYIDRLHPPAATTAPVSSTMTLTQVQQNRDAQAHNAAVRRSVTVKLRVARGLLALTGGDWARCARELGEVGEEGGLQDWEGKAIATSDVALLTAVCALATGTREYVRRILLDRASFHSAVGDSQGWILDLVRAFVDAHYGEALTILRRVEPQLLLNPLLAVQTRALVRSIRERAIVQYLTPFSSVLINSMAAAFGTPFPALLAEICALAEDGRIKAHIDLVDGILSMETKDARAAAFTTALENGRKITQMAQANMFRMRLKEAGVVVESAEEKKRRELWKRHGTVQG